MRLVEGISRADITECNAVVVAVAVIARMHSTLSLARSKDALSRMYEGRKLCDLLSILNSFQCMQYFRIYDIKYISLGIEGI